jgi:hypothetical protein
MWGKQVSPKGGESSIRLHGANPEGYFPVSGCRENFRSHVNLHVSMVNVHV